MHWLFRVYNWFSRATFCCHSLSNELLAGAQLLLNHTVSDVPAIHRPTPSRMAPCWNTDISCGISLWDRHLFHFKIHGDSFLKVFRVGEASKTLPRRTGVHPQLPAGCLPRFPWATGILKPHGHQCLCLRLRVSLWASTVKLLIGHGSSITQSNPVHPKSRPNS